MNLKISVKSILLVFACVIVMWLNASIFAIVGDRIPSVIKFGIVALWFAIAIIYEKKFLYFYLKICFPLLLMLLLMIFSNIVGIHKYFQNYFIQYLYIAVLCALYVYYFQFGSIKENKTLIIVFLIDLLVKTIRTYFLLLTNPIIVRALSTSSDFQNVLLDGAKFKGIGNYGWSYQLAFISLLVFAYFDVHKGIVLKIFKWLIIGITAIILFSAQITMALLMLIVFVFLYYEFGKPQTKMRFGSIIIGLIVILILYFNATAILTGIIKIADADLAERLENLLYALTYNDTSTGDIGVRMNLYRVSFYSFLRSPIWGSLGDRTIGFHSTFLDLLGAYGILGFCGIFGLLLPINNRFNKEALYKYRSLNMILFISFIVFSITNVSIWCDIYLVVGLIIPLGLKVLTQEEV